MGLVSVQCIDGMLHISDPEKPAYNWYLFGDGNYHMHDYDLFYMNIKNNVQSRIAAYSDQT